MQLSSVAREIVGEVAPDEFGLRENLEQLVQASAQHRRSASRWASAEYRRHGDSGASTWAHTALGRFTLPD